MPDKISVEKKDGTTAETEIIAAFDIADFGRKYVIYSFNETDPNGLAKLNVSQVIEDNGKYTFAKIETDDEWNRIKEVMRNIITGGNASYTFDPNFLTNYKQGDVIKQTDLKLIALQQSGKDQIKKKFEEAKANVQVAAQPVVENPQPVPEPAEQLEVPSDTPAVDIAIAPEASATPAVDFQAPPEALNPNTPLESMVEPLDLNATPEVQNNQPIQVEESTQPQITQPISMEEAIPAQNVLSDAEFFKQLEELINRANIRQQSIKDQMIASIHEKYNQSKNMDYIEDKVLEMSRVVETANEALKATTALQQNPQNAQVNVAPTVPNTPAPTNVATNVEPAPVNNQVVQNVTPVQNAQPTVAPTVQTPTSSAGGPTYTYQQAA